MFTEKLTLSATDYVIFGFSLVFSAAIGVFFQIFGKKKTNEEYLLAGKDMSYFPVIMSLMATFMSATTLMGIPAEMYIFGSNMAFMNVGFAIGPIISAFVFLPIYFRNDIGSVYEFLEIRFGKKIRGIIATAFALQTVLFTSATLYAPALALSAVTNLSMWLSIISIGIVCTFYCTLGGMKAVLWADVFQSILMYICLFAIIIKGTIDLGGFTNIYNIANEGGRLFIPSFSLNLSKQYTMINVLLQGFIITISSYAANQVQVQRLRTLRSLKRSRVASYWSIPLLVSFHLLCCLCGFIIYAYFKNCDPMTSPNKPIHSADQLMPYFVTSAMRDYPGLPGLCIAGLFSASLSTISSSLNSLAAVTVEDFIKPLWPRASQSVITSKVICFFYGILCIALSFLLASLGNLIKMNVIIVGLVAGPNLAIFILAACTKRTNEQGAILGAISGLVVGVFLSFLPNTCQLPLLPVSHECTDMYSASTDTSETVSLSNFHYSIVPTLKSSNETFNKSPDKSFSITLCYMWVSTITLLTSLIIGYLASIVFACFQKKHKEIPEEYLSPVRTWFSNRNSKTTPKTIEKKTVSTIFDNKFEAKLQYETNL